MELIARPYYYSKVEKLLGKGIIHIPLKDFLKNDR